MTMLMNLLTNTLNTNIFDNDLVFFLMFTGTAGLITYFFIYSHIDKNISMEIIQSIEIMKTVKT